MNKETIYIEPSDDITDILSRLKASDKKIVALVPPKKPTVLLSSVNIKLISRVAKAGKKAVVLVTTDDSLTKLAMTANLPVAPSLKSRPIMPGEEKPAKPEPKEEPDKSDADSDGDEPEAEMEEKAEEQFEDYGDEEEENGPEENEEVANDEEDDNSEDDEGEEDEEGEEDNDDDNDDNEEEDEEGDEEEDEEGDEESDEANKEKKNSKESNKTSTKSSDKKASKKEKKSKKSDEEYSNAFTKFIGQHKALIIAGAAVAIGVVVFLVWAFTIAPRVSVSISVRTNSANFSENVTFTKDSADENSTTGAFFLHEEKVEKNQTIKFTATGKKDLGETASGELILTSYFIGPGTVSVPAGSTFTFGTLNYVTLADVVLAGPADNKAKTFKATCNNYSEDFEIGVDYCQVSTAVSIKAAAPGEDYNISASGEGWSSSVANVTAYNSADITGGTSNIVTVVQQSDVDLALDKLRGDESAGSSDSKKELYNGLSKTVMPVEASYKVTTSDPQTTPAVGEEVKEGVTPQVSTNTTYFVYTIDRVRMEEFIKNKAIIEDGKRIYSYGEPFIEYFAESSGGNTYTGKLKTTYKTGPEISETEILDKIRGEKIGRIEPILKDAFPGVASVKTEKSYFWVNSIPNDENKVEINLTIEGFDNEE